VPQVTPSATCPVCSPDHGVLGLGDLEPLPDYRHNGHLLLPPPDIVRLNGQATGNAQSMAEANRDRQRVGTGLVRIGTGEDL
jgi:hypothetical protein